MTALAPMVGGIVLTAVGPAATVSVAGDTRTSSVCVVENVNCGLMCVPAVAPVTGAEKVHVPPSGMLPPVSWSVLPMRVSVPAHPREPPTGFGVPSVMPAGKGSLNIAPVKSVLPLAVFTTVMVAVEEPPCTIPVGKNVLVTVGGGDGSAATIVRLLSVVPKSEL